MTHPPDEVLIAYADANEQEAAVEKHIQTCDACANGVAFYRTLSFEMRDEEVWTAASEARTNRGLEVVREFADRIAAEDAEAKRLLENLLESPYRFTRANIVSKKRFHTGGVVRRLCEAVREQCDIEPPYAMQLVEATQFIAESLPTNYYPANAVYELRGRAWKEYATVCKYLGRFQDGLDALRRAEGAYGHLADPGGGLAAVNLSRAILLSRIQRHEEALACARKAASAYSSRRDIPRYIEAREVEAIILQRTGASIEARDIYRLAFELSGDIDDFDMKARAARNLAINYRDSHDLGNASKYFLLALQFYEASGQPVWVVRTRWSLARLALVAGNFKQASVSLRASIQELELKGLKSDAADAKLDLAETLIVLGEYAEIEALCSDVMLFYRNEEMITSALTAARFLKEAAAEHSIQRSDIAHVRSFLTQLRRDPNLLFAPPRELPRRGKD
jgi:tetratricopeptide (TPR) repeat protein